MDDTDEDESDTEDIQKDRDDLSDDGPKDDDNILGFLERKRTNVMKKSKGRET